MWTSLEKVDKNSYKAKGSEIYMYCLSTVGKCISIYHLSVNGLNIVRKVIVGVLGSYWYAPTIFIFSSSIPERGRGPISFRLVGLKHHHPISHTCTTPILVQIQQAIA